MTTGEKITAGRKKLNLTQQQFADELGVTRQAVSRWESDVAFPETDKLVKLSELFGCSIDYLIKYNQDEDKAERNDDTADNRGRKENAEGVFNPFKWSFEYKSEKCVFGMPLVHVNIGLGRRAHGFFSVGLISSGIFSLGLLSMGVFSLGILSLGLIALGQIVLAGVAFGGIAIGALAFGGVAIGLISFGGLAVGLFGCGGCSVGLFAVGGYADGHFIAVGDSAFGQIAFGKTTAVGSVLSVDSQSFERQREEAWRLMDNLPAFWRGFIDLCKNYAFRIMV